MPWPRAIYFRVRFVGGCGSVEGGRVSVESCCCRRLWRFRLRALDVVVRRRRMRENRRGVRAVDPGILNVGGWSAGDDEDVTVMKKRVCEFDSFQTT